MTTGNVVPIRADVPLPELITDEGERVPDFVTRISINEMNDDQLDAQLEQIRSRRMLSYIIYRQTEEDRKAVTEAKAAVRLDTKMNQIAKDLEQFDKLFDRLEKHVHELRGLRIQAGMTVL